MKRIPLLLGLMLLLAACEKDIEFNGEVTDPLMVVNAIIPQDSLLEVKITKSRFFMQYEDTFETVKDATVELYVNGEFSESMLHAGNGRYISHYKLIEGDRIHLVSRAPNLKTTTADMQVVPPVTVVKLDTSLVIHAQNPILGFRFDDYENIITDTIGWTYWCTVNCKLTFSDPPNSENFYRLAILNKYYIDSVNYNTNYEWFEKTDVVFGENNQAANDMIDEGNYNTYGTFTDDLFDGKKYRLTFSFDATFRHYKNGTPPSDYIPSGGGFYTAKPNELYIDIQHLSKSYYLYLVTSSKYNNDDLFAEPVQIHSNVNGGIGILGNYSHNLIQLNSTF